MKKNKKGGISGLCAIIIFTFVIIATLSIILSIIMQGEEVDKACRKIGYSEYKYKQGFEFCEDKEGNLNYIKYECNYMMELIDLFPTRCIAKKISVGDVEVKK